MSWFAVPISRFVDPVFLGLVAVGLGLIFSMVRAPAGRRRWLGVGRALCLLGWLGLWLLASPWFSVRLARSLEAQPEELGPALEGTTAEQRALVVLSASMARDEHGTPAVERLSGDTLARALGAARIYRTYGFGRVIVSGRLATVGSSELAQGIADLLVALGVPKGDILLETESLDTRENAIHSARMARELGVERVVVVTSALHMPRAQQLFERVGLRVVPAPVHFTGPPPEGLVSAVPTALSLVRSQRVVHELAGRLEP